MSLAVITSEITGGLIFMRLMQALDGFVLYQRAIGRSPRTIETHLYLLRAFAKYIGDPEVDQITTKDLQSFLVAYGENRAAETKKRVWVSFRTLIKWASPEFGMENPAIQIPMPKGKSKPVHPFTRQDIQALLAVCDRTRTAKTTRRKAFTMPRPTARRDRALILLLLDTGLRVSEIARLTIADVDLENREVVVLPLRHNSKSRPRAIPLSYRCSQAIWHYLARRKDVQMAHDPGRLPLFVDNEERNALNRHAIRKLLSRLGERAGVPKTHPHRFRHTFAIEYLRNDGDVFTLKRILGHSSLAMVERYLEIAKADVKKAHRRASPVENWKL